MRSHLEFRSIELVDVCADAGIPRGEKLARLLGDNLISRGFVVTDIAPEDWGWRVQVKNQAFSLWLGCGHYQEYDDGHLCFVEPSKPFVRRWLRRISTREEVEQLATALEEIVRAGPGTYDVRWWTDAEVARG